MWRFLILLLVLGCAGADGPTGPQGPAGADGSEGSQGPAGPVGPGLQWVTMESNEFSEACPWGGKEWICESFQLPSSFDGSDPPGFQCQVERGPIRGYWQPTAMCTLSQTGEAWIVTAWDDNGGAGPVRIIAWGQ